MFLQNKYTKWYFSIINNALDRNWTKKNSSMRLEGHHIIPKSILKNKDIVYLTPKEHFICHLLLTKMVDGNNKIKMIFALTSMKMKTERTNERYFNSKLYETARKELSEFKKQQWLDTNYRNYMSQKISETHWDVSGKNNPMYGKKGVLSPHFGKQKSEEHRSKIKNSLLGIKHSTERKHNMSVNCPKNSLGKKWYHNPLTKQQKYFIDILEILFLYSMIFFSVILYIISYY